MVKEELTPEQKEEAREVALKNLGSNLWNYATPKLVTSAQYGQLSEVAKSLYPQLISQSPPNAELWRQLTPLLAKEGAITSPYLQTVSAKILQESIAMLKVEDVYGAFGMDKSMKKDYAGKYVFELPEEEVKNIIGSYMNFRTFDIVKGLLDMNKQGIKKGLEGILCESEEQKEPEMLKV